MKFFTFGERKCFNTQPPEGGWLLQQTRVWIGNSFNTQPPEGGWQYFNVTIASVCGFNTQPPEGGWT